MFNYLAHLTISHQPKQNQAEGGTAHIKTNPTQLSEWMPHHVKSFGFSVDLHIEQQAFEAKVNFTAQSENGAVAERAFLFVLAFMSNFIPGIYHC